MKLISPYRGKLVDLLVNRDESSELFAYAAGLPSIQITNRELCDLEMLATGGFSPLTTFMSEADYRNVLECMRLANGTVFPIPITLSTNELGEIRIGSDITLRSPRNEILAIMTVDEIYEWDRDDYTESVLGTSDPRHPLVAEANDWGRFHLSGQLRVLALPQYHDFLDLRLTPKQTRMRLEELGRSKVVAFQTRNPTHRGHEVMTIKAMEMIDGTLLFHPVVGMTKEGDVDHFTRVRAYKAVTAACYPKERVVLSLLPLAMRMAGPREAVFHAIIRKNYGANHFIVGRDHASPGSDAVGKPFYDPLAAQELAVELSDEIGVKIIPFQEISYVPDESRYETKRSLTNGKNAVALSGTSVRSDYLANGKAIPEWMMRKEIALILSDAFPSRCSQGFCLWFTGLSGAGKSTTAEIVTALLLEEGRRVTVLDGDVVRTHLSKGLGFSKEDRDTNVTRIGFVASEVVRHGGVAICASVSPYRQSRNKVRQMFGGEQFVEIYVAAPLDVCESRDPKGIYARARRGEIKDLTGIDDTYEVPEGAEITLDAVGRTARENAEAIVEFLRSKGFLARQLSWANG